MIDRILMAARICSEKGAATTKDMRRAAFRELMRLVDDYFAEGRSASHCKACRAPIVWVETPGGKKAPLDATPIVGLDVNGEQRRIYISHFATCPSRNQFTTTP